jgi:assimilatory nitrate reductase catalytic subunit
MADLFLPIQPGTDVMLFHGLLHIMLWEGWTDAGSTSRPHHGL